MFHQYTASRRLPLVLNELLISTQQSWYLYMKGYIMGRIIIPNPLLSTPSLDHQLRMVNSREHAIDSLPASGTRGTCASRRSLRLGTSPDQPEPSSYAPGVLAPCGWFLYVGLPPIGYFAVPMCCIIYSWEYLITLDLEWNVIRGRRPHRWTIWVRSPSPFYSATLRWPTI